LAAGDSGAARVGVPLPARGGSPTGDGDSGHRRRGRLLAGQRRPAPGSGNRSRAGANPAARPAGRTVLAVDPRGVAVRRARGAVGQVSADGGSAQRARAAADFYSRLGRRRARPAADSRGVERLPPRGAGCRCSSRSLDLPGGDDVRRDRFCRRRGHDNLCPGRTVRRLRSTGGRLGTGDQSRPAPAD
jgi:hypothetical protein